MSIPLFKKIYDGESIVDVSRDMSEMLNPAFNPPSGEIPRDQYGFPQATITVTVTWESIDEG